MNIILTGGPCGGKTTTIIDLELRGFEVVRETASDLIKLMQSEGMHKPWAQPHFQRRILYLQTLRYKKITAQAGIIFHDRGPLDTLTYQERNFPGTYTVVKHRAFELNKMFEPIVFVMKNLGNCERTDIRHEEMDEALEIEARLIATYRAHGYEVIEIEPDTVAARSEKIMAILEERGLLTAH